MAIHSQCHLPRSPVSGGHIPIRRIHQTRRELLDQQAGMISTTMAIIHLTTRRAKGHTVNISFERGREITRLGRLQRQTPHRL